MQLIGFIIYFPKLLFLFFFRKKPFHVSIIFKLFLEENIMMHFKKQWFTKLATVNHCFLKVHHFENDGSVERPRPKRKINSSLANKYDRIDQ